MAARSTNLHRCSYQLVHVCLLTSALPILQLTQSRFVVYAASAIYIIGIPGVMIEHGIDEQEALLGLSLYVLACKSNSCHETYQTTNAISRRLGTHALGAAE
jgi:hypothetical protein